MVSATGDHRTEVPTMLASAGTNRQSGPMPPEREALLVTGIYGSGKTSLVEEIADRYERLGVAFGAIDLDWLGWYHLPEATGCRPAARPSAGEPHATSQDATGGQASSTCSSPAPPGTMPTCSAFVRLFRVPSEWSCSTPRSRLSSGASPKYPPVAVRTTCGSLEDWVSRDLGRVSADLTLSGETPLPTLAEEVLTWLDWPRVR